LGGEVISKVYGNSKKQSKKRSCKFFFIAKILKMQETHVSLLKDVEQKGSTAQNVELEEVSGKNSPIPTFTQIMP
jgi:hypothetical protein